MTLHLCAVGVLADVLLQGSNCSADAAQGCELAIGGVGTCELQQRSGKRLQCTSDAGQLWSKMLLGLFALPVHTSLT